MSLKPSKKSDSDKEWMSKRADRKKLINPEYHLIVTEGIKTEPNYFQGIKKRINRDYRERIHLEIEGEGTNTVELFEEAKRIVDKNPNGYRHVWIVYDTDDFPAESINKVVELCKENSTAECTYHAVWSNQCIEFWFLLHFSFEQSDLHRNQYFEKLSRCFRDNGVAGTYEKNREDIFEILLPFLGNAIRNASKLDELNKGKTPANSCPGTKVFELMKKLKFYLK